MAKQFNCTVVLKGSGTIVASPGETPCINTTGNGLLATAGTGDVLAGIIGALLAAKVPAFEAAAAGDDGDVHELGGHARGIFAAHATGEQAGEQVEGAETQRPQRRVPQARGGGREGGRRSSGHRESK